MSEWQKVCALEEIPKLGSRVLQTKKGDVAIFRNDVDEVFALNDKCPHKGGPLSQGIVFERKVTCPLHGLTVQLDSGEAVAPDKGCVHHHQVRLEEGGVYLRLS